MTQTGKRPAPPQNRPIRNGTYIRQSNAASHEDRREDAMRAAAHQQALNEWRRACDGLLAALCYAKNGFQPPADTDVHPTAEQFRERLVALVEVVNTWTGVETTDHQAAVTA